MLSRRSLLAASALGLASASSPALAQRKAPTPGPTLDVAKLMAGGPLPDKVLGSADAKVTIVEYASFTCSHCARFHTMTLPVLKERYINPGKVKLVFREFSFDPVAAAVAMLSRCAPEDKYFEVAAAFFQEQGNWAQNQNVVGALRSLAGQMGFTQESFNACLTNQTLLDGVNAQKAKGETEFNVDSTPTFFINGVTYKGAMSIEEFEAILLPLLQG